MTGTEMIDAIAHIDEDLIDGCVARMKARSSETVALHAKEEIREKTKKPLPAFAKAAIAFGALAAVLLLSFALISLLHIGGKSPTPIGPVSTQTPAPTEAGNEDGESPFRYSVAVVLDNEESLKFKTYGAEDFPEADAIEVVNVSEALEKSIRELVENGVNNEDVKEYNKCLRIVLKDPCEENASACASRLRERYHVVSAEPYLEPYDVTIEGLRCSIAETMLNAVGKITVADRVFLYPSSFHIDVTNEEDGRVYDLSYAYKNGMMTYDGLSELYRIHVEYMIRKFGYTEETYKKEAFVHYAFIGSCEIGFAHEETGEIEVKDVAGSKFIFAHPFTIVVQKIGEEDILDITEAYEAGLLTEEDVAEAARLHREFVISTFDFGEKLYEELAAEPAEAPTPVDTFAEEILSVPVKWYSYDELSASPELGEEMTYLESIEDMEMVHYSPDAFLVTDDGEIAIVDTVGARLCVYDLASGQLKKSVPVGQILEADPVRAAKYGGVYYVLIPYSDSRIVAVYPDGTTSEIPVPQLQGMLEYCHVSEYYAEDGRLILTLIGPDLIMTKAVSLSDGSVTSLYSTQWTLENDTFTVTRNGMIWSFPAEPSSGVRSTRIDVLKVGENGELYVIQEVPIEGQDDMGLYQIYDKDGRLLRCEKIDYFMDSYMTADGGRTVGPDDYLYEMHCDEDAVRIFRIVPAEPTEAPTPAPTAMPERPGENTNIPRVIAGKDVFFIVKPDGALYAWGNNEFGQLGVGDTENRTEPVLAANGLVPVVVGDTVYAIDENGVLWGWGRNDHGQLGTGDSENRDLPFEILENVREVFPARNRFTCYALTNDGSVYKWGWEEDASLTDEERAALSKPTVYYENVLDFKINSLVTSDGSLMALSYSGEWEKYAENAKRLWCDFRTCPIYEDGAGDLWSLYGNEPTLIARNVRCVSVSGNLHEDQPEVFVLADDGSLYRFDPLTNTTDFIMNEVVEIYADCLKDEDFAYEVRFALKANGELWSWGQHSNAALGKSADNAENAPALVMENVKEFLTNGAATYVITESGELYASGINAGHSSMNGALGDGSAEDRYGFVQLLPGRVCRITNYFGIEIVEAGDDGDCAILISRTYAVDDAGHIRAWGWNDSGFLGVGSDEDEVLSPTELLNE